MVPFTRHMVEGFEHVPWMEETMHWSHCRVPFMSLIRKWVYIKTLGSHGVTAGRSWFFNLEAILET